MNTLRRFVCALVVLSVTAQAAVADGIIVDSVEAISAGRGGTNIAQSDNGGVILSNPSGILNADGDGLWEVGAEGLITDLHYSNPLNDDIAAHDRPIALPSFAYFQKSADGNWAAGLGVFAPAGFAAGWDLTNNALGTQSYQSFGALLKVLPAFAYKVAENLSIGATCGVAVSNADLRAPFYLDAGGMAVPARIGLQGWGVAPTWSVGLQYQMTPSTTFGVVYSSEDRFNLDGHMNADVYMGGPPVYTHFDSTMNIVWPQSVGIGLKQQLTDRQRVSVDLLWYDWAQAFRSIDLTLTNSSNPLFTELLGPSFHDSIPLDWMDSLSVRVGYEWSYSENNVLRAGYVYSSPEIPNSTLTPLIPAILEHTFTIGHGTTFCDDWRLDVAYQFGFGPSREVNTSALVGGDFSESTVRAEAHWLAISLTHTF
jgi:long-chain fatty acid transport protein